ncbi:6-phosphogluconolactonase [Loktanella fryxellensis]|uniref:6-phosphogluconolactonase n=1 Tax=Loktanella fryxellensis TaxID=245187 RepID=A0A1H8BED4_9RHOB|nr:6-phosphogluconolactonase [Loktanella fryxellensis]SEM81183.1 6-phosphogluconolactonase [Loktanella fryxellensis]
MNLIEYADGEMMMISLANILAGELRQTLQTQDFASFAVPGGTTPGPIFDNLCSANLDWARVHVLLTDERWVPESSDRSNTRLVRQRLLTDRAGEAQYVPLRNDAATPEDGLPALREGLAAVLPLSVVLLGMGADMHTASIFPGADQLDLALQGSDTLVAMRAPGAPEPRITLSAHVLRKAMNRHLVILGRDKREAVERAATLTPEEAPVAAILPGTTIHWAE